MSVWRICSVWKDFCAWFPLQHFENVPDFLKTCLHLFFDACCICFFSGLCCFSVVCGFFFGQWFQLIVNDHKFFECLTWKSTIYFLFQWGGNLRLKFSNIQRFTVLHKNIHLVVTQRKTNAHWCHILQGCSSSGVYSWQNLILPS